MCIRDRPGGKTHVKGYINTSSEAENKNMTNLKEFKTNLTGWYSPGEDWGVRLQNLEMTLPSKKLEPLNIIFEKKMGARWQDFSFFLDGAKLDILLSFFKNPVENKTTVSTWLNRLKPEGEIIALMAGKDSGKIFADVTLEEFSSVNFKGIPRIQDLDAKL